MHSPLIIIRGAGDLATGVAIRLYRAGFTKLLMLEIDSPLTVRRTIAFSEAIYQQHVQVEGIKAVAISSPLFASYVWNKKSIPVLIDPDGTCFSHLHPEVVVDSIIAKRNTGTTRGMGQFTIGLGPGFIAPQEVHAVVETKRGHNLGRVIYDGSAIPDTGRPGSVKGYTVERVYWAPANGVFNTSKKIGDTITIGEQLGTIGKTAIRARISGIIRGLLPTSTGVTKKTKLGDIDPRAVVSHCHSVSDKALAIGGGVLEAICAHLSSRSRQC